MMGRKRKGLLSKAEKIRARRQELAELYKDDLVTLKTLPEWKHLAIVDRFSETEMIYFLNKVYANNRHLGVLEGKQYDRLKEPWMPTSRTIKDRFGGWNNACDLAKVPHGHSGVTPSSSSEEFRELCRNSILLAAQAYDTHFTFLRLTDYNQFYKDYRDKYPVASAWKIRRYFGGSGRSWRDAVSELFAEEIAAETGKMLL